MVFFKKINLFTSNTYLIWTNTTSNLIEFKGKSFWGDLLNFYDTGLLHNFI